jgi:protein-S-isoprenylcysteine O-methyltransferase Ste14
LPIHEGDGFPEAPLQIRWNRVSTITEGSKVFIGGGILSQNNRLSFVSTKEQPLMVIFYDCPDAALTGVIIRAARTRNEYWNTITPVSLAIGALSLIYIAASFLSRPAFRLTVISALSAVFIPILPVLPPGFLFTSLYRRFTWDSRKLRADYDLARFGLLSEITIRSPYYFALRAYALELLAWALLLTGICINIIFICLILYLFGIISF